VSGFEGSPRRNCSVDGVWEDVADPCAAVVSPCPAEPRYLNAVWQETPANEYAMGTCRAGFKDSDNGSPRRLCVYFEGNFSTAWSADVENPCVIGTTLL